MKQKDDAVIREAKARMVAAGEAYNRGVAAMRAELRAAMKLLAEHPGYVSAVAARERPGDEPNPGDHTLAFWLYMLAEDGEAGYPHSGVRVLHVGRDLITDARGGAEKQMRAALRDEVRVAKVRSRRAHDGLHA